MAKLEDEGPPLQQPAPGLAGCLRRSFRKEDALIEVGKVLTGDASYGKISYF